MLSDLFRWWGIAQYPSEPDSQALSVAQRTCDELAEEIQARAAAGLSTIQTEEMRSLVWDYMWDLYKSVTRNQETIFTRATSPEELDAAITAEMMPLETSGGIDFEAIKNAFPVEEFASRYTELRERGGKFAGSCPLPGHSDSTPSFYVYPETRSWYCFGCAKGGDVIDLAKELDVGLDN